MNQPPYSISHLNAPEYKDRLWRVEWLGGDIKINSNVESEPTLKILLGLIKENYEGNLASTEAIEKWETTEIGVGQIVNLSVGSLLKNGKLLQQTVGSKEKLTINSENASLFKATDKIGNQNIITYADHRTSGFGKDSWCLCFPLGDDPAGIIIPITEIIRFYFATSTLLSKAIYTGEISHNINKFVNLNFSGMKNNTYCVVHRRQIVSDNDCWVLGRILNDETAYKAAQEVHDSLMFQKYNKASNLHPKTILPFMGETELTVRSKTIGYNHRRILVLRILNCTHPFPFETLEVLADNDGRKANSETDKPDSEKKEINRPQKTNKKTQEKPLSSTEEPDNSIEPDIFKNDTNRFEHIKNKEIKKTEKDQCDYKAGQMKTQIHDTLYKQYGTGDGKFTESETKKANLQDDKASLPADFETFKKIIDILNEYPDVDAELISIDDHSILGTAPAPLLTSSKKRQWSYFSFDKKKKIGKRRLFMIAEITLRNINLLEKFIIIDTEGRHENDSYKYEILQYFGDLHMSTKLIVDKMTQLFGRLGDLQNISSGIKRKQTGLKHSSKTVEHIAEKIYKLIKSNV